MTTITFTVPERGTAERLDPLTVMYVGDPSPKKEREIPIWSWLPKSEIEHGALEQIRNIAALPCAVHVAVMPDVHRGYGMPIGCALATKDAVVPYAVGVDIGCGMVAQPLGILATELPVESILRAIYDRVPVGIGGKGRPRDAGSHTLRQNSQVLQEWAESATPMDRNLREHADRQLGTVGSGNHFVELQADEQGDAWLMLHTGSRSFGKAVCDFWHARALEWCERYFVALPDRDLAFLALDTEDGQEYLRDMGFAMRFAEENRARIRMVCIDAITAAMPDAGTTGWGDLIKTHHNFAAVERHFGNSVVVHRKGAVLTVASRGNPLRVTIPGSMQTGSYIGEGISNPLALNTCAHGAGRRLGRNEAKRQNAGRDIRVEMEAQGIALIVPEGADVLDEGGFAYKAIEDVMRYQADLVRPVVKLRPLGVVKG